MDRCYATPCTATRCTATPCKWSPHTIIDDYDLTYLAAAPIAAALLAGQDKADLRGVADAAIRMAEELRDAQSRLSRERHEAQTKRRIEAENRHFRETASEATLESHERLEQQFQTQHDRQVQKDASGKS